MATFAVSAMMKDPADQCIWQSSKLAAHDHMQVAHSQLHVPASSQMLTEPGGDLWLLRMAMALDICFSCHQPHCSPHQLQQ